MNLKKIKNIDLKKERVFVAGPCVIENYDMMKATAEFLLEMRNKKSVSIIFKISYDKANRSSIDSFRGPGLKKGIEIIRKIKDNFVYSLYY